MATKLLSREEVMGMLQVKPSHFSKISNGKIKGLPPLVAVRIGRLQRFRPETVEQWIRKVEELECSAAL